MSLKDKVAFIAGGTGIVGGGIAVELLKNGCKVWVSSRNESKLIQFKDNLQDDLKTNLGTIKGEVETETECEKIRDHILSVDNKIDYVVSSLGGWWMKGKLSDQSLDEFNTVMKSAVSSHFIVYKTFAKLLAQNPNSTYTFINGGSAELIEEGQLFPADASLIPVISGAVFGLYGSAASEFANHPNLSVNQLRIFIWVKNQPDSNYDPKKSEHEVGNDFIGRFALRVIQKHKTGNFKIKSRSQANEEYEKL